MNSDNQLQRQDQGSTLITRLNYSEKWPLLPVKADLSQHEVLNLDTPAISLLNRGTGGKAIGLQVFKLAILEVLEYYGAEWSGYQIDETAELMHSEYHWLQFAELKHFIQKCKKGEYNVKQSVAKQDLDGGWMATEEWDGKIYGKFAPANLMKWIDAYAGESLATRGGMRIEQKSQPEPEQLTEAEAKERDKWGSEAMRAVEDMITGWQAWQAPVTPEQKEEQRKERLEQQRKLAGFDNIPEEMRKQAEEEYKHLKCRIVAEAIATNSKDKLLLQHRQIQANYPELVEKYLREYECKVKTPDPLEVAQAIVENNPIARTMPYVKVAQDHQREVEIFLKGLRA